MATNEARKITASEKIEAAKKFKAEGNELHQKQEFKKAIRKYHIALIQLKANESDKMGLDSVLMMSGSEAESLGLTEKLTEEEKLTTKKLSADCYNNLAACLLKLPDPNYEKVLEYCSKVLELDLGNVKTHFRRGLALYNLKKYEEALESFQQAEKLDSSFSAALIAKHKNLCKEGIKKDEQKLKNAYSGMFSKTSTKEDSNG